MTKQFEFSPEIVKGVNYQRCHPLVPLVQGRMDAIRFKAFGMLHKDIAELIGITENTLRCCNVRLLPAKADPDKQKRVFGAKTAETLVIKSTGLRCLKCCTLCKLFASRPSSPMDELWYQISPQWIINRFPAQRHIYFSIFEHPAIG